jgi:uncharacterized RmlC-like cupin family protein
LARGEKAPRPKGTAVTTSVWVRAAECIGFKEIGRDVSDLLPDGTRECERCGLPMMPVAESDGWVTLECANRHRHGVPLPSDLALRERVRSWIMRRGAQLHVQHERWEAEEEYRTAMEKKQPRLIRPSDRHQQTGQTAGMIREEAVHTEGLWVGVVRTEAGRSSSWHHHGTHESVIYVVSGQVHVECGPGGRTTLRARVGDCIYLPTGEIHREGNDGLEESEIVVVRSGTGELVVNVAGPAA